MPQRVLTPEIEIIINVGQQRRWTTAEKIRIVKWTLDGQASISVVASRNGVGANLLYHWHRLMLEGGSVAVTDDDEVTSNHVVRSHQSALQVAERDSVQRWLGKTGQGR